MKRRQTSTTSSAPATHPAAPATGPSAAAPAGRAGNADRALTLQARVAALNARGTLPHRRHVEATLGADLGWMRVAVGGPDASSLLDDEGAEAMALGDTLLFADPNPSPALVAHEAAHALQQNPSRNEQLRSGPAAVPRASHDRAEAEAEAAEHAARRGEAHAVGSSSAGGAQHKPKSQGAAKGSVTLSYGSSSIQTWSGVAAGAGVQAAHDLLRARPPVGPCDVKIVITGKVRQDHQVLWSYYNAEHRISFEGRLGDGQQAELNGFLGRDGAKNATPGYCIAYRPVLPAGLGTGTAAEANLSMKNLIIRGYVSGGVEISPRSESQLAADRQPTHPEAGKGHAGEHLQMKNAYFEGNTFTEMGTRYLGPGKERYNPSEDYDNYGDNYKYAGYAGIMARGLVDSTFVDNQFANLENRNSKKAAPDGSPVTWLGLMHGIYLRDHSSRNTIQENGFDTISGAAVKFTNASHHNKVLGNTANHAGRDSFVLNQYNPSRGPGKHALLAFFKERGQRGLSKAEVMEMTKPLFAFEADSLGTELDNKQLGWSYGGWGGKPKRLRQSQKKVAPGQWTPENIWPVYLEYLASPAP